METKQHFGFHEVGVFLIAPTRRNFWRKLDAHFQSM